MEAKAVKSPPNVGGLYIRGCTVRVAFDANFAWQSLRSQSLVWPTEDRDSLPQKSSYLANVSKCHSSQTARSASVHSRSYLGPPWASVVTYHGKCGVPTFGLNVRSPMLGAGCIEMSGDGLKQISDLVPRPVKE